VGEEFTAKDFRTWVGTVTAAASLFGCGCPQTAKETRTNLLQAIDAAALRLGNTRTICKASYVHPEVLLAFEEGRMLPLPKAKPSGGTELDPVEKATLRLLKIAARPNKPRSRSRTRSRSRAATRSRFPRNAWPTNTRARISRTSTTWPLSMPTSCRWPR